MKLHTKLIISILMILIVSIIIEQVFQYFKVINIIEQLIESNTLSLKNEIKKNALNINESIHNAVSGSLERGEMEKFSKLMKLQKTNKTLLEMSLYDVDCKISYSTNDLKIGTNISADLKKQIYDEKKQILLFNDKLIDVYQPQMITGDCIRCHTDWKTGDIGGIIQTTFSTEIITKTLSQANTTLIQLKKSSIFNTLISIIGTTIIFAVLVFILLNKMVRLPLGQFVELLRWYEEKEGDLTMKIQIYTSDEIGELANLFNTFIDRLKDVITKAQHNALNVGQGAKRQLKDLNNIRLLIEKNVLTSEKNHKKSENINELMQDVSKDIDKSDLAMKNLTDSMEKLSQASVETAKIVKTIDEIAFQTNLLALNAAVEAARAGEAGAGFAIVADEVRNLAMRSAEAAKNTSNQIDLTVKQINEGSGLVTKTSDTFKDLKENINNANSLVSEITELSQNQSKDMKEIDSSLSKVLEDAETNVNNATEIEETMSSFKTEDEDNNNNKDNFNDDFTREEIDYDYH